MGNPIGTSVAVVGGGYAGLAAAVELAHHNIPVTVYEAASELGGRARRVERHGFELDNGQHILLGAYTSTLELMQRVGAPNSNLLRLPLQWRFPPHFELNAAPVPAPWHLAIGLLTARGLNLTARLKCASFLHWSKRVGFRLTRDRSVSSLLQEHRQPAAAVRFLWEPLCVAALNTPPNDASAQVFLNVLRDGLVAGRSASDLLLPTTDLTQLFPRPAIEYIAARGGTVRTACRVQRIEGDGTSFEISTTTEQHRHCAVVIATAPHHVTSLVEHLDGLGDSLDTIARLTYQPIVTVYLHYPQPPRLAGPMLGLCGRYGQWLFDRSRISGQAGLVAVVISASARNEQRSHASLAALVHSEIAPLLAITCAPDWTQVIEEKRATFACLANMPRPESQTGIPGLYLAGDYIASDYPATIEAAVRSGLSCATLARHAMETS